MPVEYTIDHERNLLVGRAYGVLSPRELIEAFAEIVRATGGAAVNMDHLFVSAPDTELYEMDAAGMAAMREALEAHHRAHPGRAIRAAIVVRSGDPLGSIARLWQAIADAHPAMATKVRVCHSEEEALAWLASNAD